MLYAGHLAASTYILPPTVFWKGELLHMFFFCDSFSLFYPENPDYSLSVAKFEHFGYE